MKHQTIKLLYKDKKTYKVNQTILLEGYQLGSLNLKNKVVKSPMTRCRVTPDHIPTSELMAEYYGQRTGISLLITEGLRLRQMELDMRAFQVFIIKIK